MQKLFSANLPFIYDEIAVHCAKRNTSLKKPVATNSDFLAYATLKIGIFKLNFSK